MAEAGSWLPAALTLDPLERTKTSIPDAKVAEPAETVVRASGVRFGYDRAQPIIRDASLTAAAGERIALVGPNGSGKSTLGRLLVGLLRPDHGQVALMGVDPARLPAADLARKAGYAFQDPERQFLSERVGDEIALGLTPPEAARAADLMERLGLPLGQFAERSPYRLSGGEQRRLSLACILVRRPAMLVLDEPTFGQDRSGYEALLEILREHVEHGVCLVAATHDERFVNDMANRVVRLDDGWIMDDRAFGVAPRDDLGEPTGMAPS